MVRKKPFEEGKSWQELGIDLERDFVVVDPMVPYNSGYFPKGSIIRVQEPRFTKDGVLGDDFIMESSGKTAFMYWKELAYADEPKVEELLAVDAGSRDGDQSAFVFGERSKDGKVAVRHVVTSDTSPEEPYVPKKGDAISIGGNVESVGGDIVTVLIPIGEDSMPLKFAFFLKEMPSSLKLLSRPPKRRVTLAEINEKFGEEVEIIKE